MNLNLLKYCVLILLVTCVAAEFKAQCTLEIISIEEVIENAEQSFLGQVSHKETIYNQSKNRIYTLYTIHTINAVEIIAVPGGTWQNITEILAPNANISLGDHGLFLVDQHIYLDALNTEIPLIGPYNYLIYDEVSSLFSSPAHSYESEQILDLLPSLKNALTDEKLDIPSTKSIPPVVDSIVPKTFTAGTETVITIHGKNFGINPDGTSLVEFRNPDIGTLIIGYQGVPGNHIISWSDTTIQLFVPGRDPSLNRAGAGSGQIRVTNDVGQVSNGPSVTVLYNRFVKGVEDQLLYQNDNSLGGYSLNFNTSLVNNSAAFEDFNRAVEKWQCGIQSNIVIGPETEIACKANDGINLVAFDTNCALPSGVLAQTTHWFLTCEDGTPIFLEMDIIIDNEVAWHYSDDPTPNDRYDFETLALHELGHFHGIGHNLENNSLMFPTIFPGVAIDTIDKHTISCGKQIVQQSEVLDLDCISENYVSFPSCNAECNLSLSLSAVGECQISEDITYTFSIINEYQESSGFKVYIDDQTEPIISSLYDGDNTLFSIDLLSLGDDYLITVVDSDNEECRSAVTITTSDCTCRMIGTLTQLEPCASNDSILYRLFIDTENPGANGFDFYLNDVLQSGSPFSYGTSNTELSFYVLGDDQEYSLQLIDNDKAYCRYEETFTTEDCVCRLEGSLEFQSCQLGKAKYTLTFSSENVNDSGYDIYVNGTLYNMTPLAYAADGNNQVEIELIGDGAEQKITVVDYLEMNCELNLDIDVQNCVCEIGSMTSVGTCNEGLAEVIIAIDLDSISFSDFTMYIDGNPTTPINIMYDQDSTFLIFNLLGDGMEYVFTADNTLCTLSSTFQLPDCQCSIEVLEFEVGSCEDYDLVSMMITVLHKNLSDTYFVVYIDDNTTESIHFPFNQSSDTTIFELFIQGDGATHSITIADPETALCKDEIDFSVPNCECNLAYKIESAAPCDDARMERYQITILDSPDDIFVNVILDGVLLTADPISINDLITMPMNFSIRGDGDFHFLTVIDVNNEICFSTTSFQTSFCPCLLNIETNIIGPCTKEGFYPVQVTINNAIIGNEYAIFNDNIEIEGSPFIHEVEPSIYTFFLSADAVEHTIRIEDLVINCIVSEYIFIPLCPCSLEITGELLTECDEQDMDNWQLIISSVDSIVNSFDVYIDDTYLSSYNHTNPETEIFISLPGDGFDHSILIQNTDYEDCQNSTTLISNDCACRIDASLSISSDCTNGEVELSGVINYKNSSKSSFDLFIDDQFVQSMEHISTDMLSFNAMIIGDGMEHVVTIMDSQKTNCLFESVVQAPICTEQNCDFSFSNFTDFQCQNANATGSFQFLSMKSSNELYRVLINGIEQETSPYTYNPSGINTISISSNNCDSISIEIFDLDNTDCILDTIISPVIDRKLFIYYPNPQFGDRTLFIENIDSSDFDQLLNFQLFNRLNQLVFASKIIGNEKMKLDLAKVNLVPGIYIFTLGPRNRYSGKLVIL